MSSKAALLILDGWGLSSDPAVSAIDQAQTPFMDSLYKKYSSSKLITFGTDVGLPVGQMGNSEVGHLNIGAGRIVFQELERINQSIQNGTLFQNASLVASMKKAVESGCCLHLMGLVSDGGVHSHISHLKALCAMADQFGVNDIAIHCFLDGRDTSPDSGVSFVEDLEAHIRGTRAKIATVVGRYYAMDRDKRWERIKKAYDLLTDSDLNRSDQMVKEAIQSQYDKGITDEFIEPIRFTDQKLKDDDVLICFNFRTDRPRQISEVLTQQSYPAFDMHPLRLHYTTMTRYDDRFENVNVVYEKQELKMTLGEVLQKAGKSQLRMAETEKYPHVTFFFSGGQENPFDQEKRQIIPSPKVATYDLQPEMSAITLTDKLTQSLQSDQPDFICVNYANTDMVGHTGVFAAAVKAAEAVDGCLSQIVPDLLEKGYQILIIADHGNADKMLNEDGSPHTAHTTNLVPCIYLTKEQNQGSLRDGILADIAPTILQMMQVEQPIEMTGTSLLYKQR